MLPIKKNFRLNGSLGFLYFVCFYHSWWKYWSWDAMSPGSRRNNTVALLQKLDLKYWSIPDSSKQQLNPLFFSFGLFPSTPPNWRGLLSHSLKDELCKKGQALHTPKPLWSRRALSVLPESSLGFWEDSWVWVGLSFWGESIGSLITAASSSKVAQRFLAEGDAQNSVFAAYVPWQEPCSSEVGREKPNFN